MFALPLRVKPGASRTAVGGTYDGPYGPALVVAVPAPAVDGRATDAALRAVAEALGVRPRTVTLRSGAASRDKLVMVDDDTVEGRAAELLQGGSRATTPSPLLHDGSRATYSSPLLHGGSRATHSSSPGDGAAAR